MSLIVGGSFISSRVPNPGPITQIQPFTYEDGTTFTELLADIRRYIVKNLEPYLVSLGIEIDEKIITLIQSVDAALDAQTELVDDKLAAQDAANTIAINNLITFVNEAVQAIIDDSIQVQDPVMAGILGDDESATRAVIDGLFAPAALEETVTDGFTTVNAQRVLDRRDVSVAEHGAVADGVTDNAAAFNAASAAAVAAGVGVYIPVGNYRVGGPVNFYGNLTSDGLIKIATTSAGSINFLRTNTAVVLPAGGLTGLTAGSTKIGGLGGRMGTLGLVSTEKLIVRADTPTNPWYVKTDIVKIIDDQGTVSPALESTYAPEHLTVTVYPTDAPITVRGLRVELDGAAQGASNFFVSILRSNVTTIDSSLINLTAYPLVVGIMVRDSTDVTFTRVTVSGFSLDGSGYGVAVFNSSFLTFNDCTVSKCRHALSGRHTKQMVLNGGSYEGGIDSHWNVGLYLNNVTSIVGVGISHIAIAGAGVSIRNSRFLGGRNVIGVRLDTPELSGIVEMMDNYWKPHATAQPWMIGYSSLSRTVWNFERVIKSPSNVKVLRPTVEFDTAWPVRLIDVSGIFPFDSTYWSNVEIDGATFINCSQGYGFVGIKVDAYHTTETKGSSILVSNSTFPAVGQAVLIADSEDSGVGGMFEFDIINVKNADVSIAERAVSRGVIRDSIVKGFRRTAASASNTFSGEFAIINSLIKAASFSGLFKMAFQGNTFSGATVSSNETMNNRSKSYLNNMRDLTASNAPTHPNNYLNPLYYT